MILFFTWKLFKIPKLDCMTLVTGGIKTGKSMLSVWLALRVYKRQLRHWKVKCFFIKLINVFKRKMPLTFPEEPLLYSNVKLAGVKYVELTDELILRQKRFNYKSVVLVQEASLLADSMYTSNLEDNERLLLLNKLIGHETRGGYIFYDTQSVQDCHYSVKRCLNSLLYIHHNIKIPFFCILAVREMAYSADDNLGIRNEFDSDVEDTMQLIIVPKRIWKYYDCYTYSCLTDHLEVESKTHFQKLPKPFKRVNLKTNKIVSLKKFRTVDQKYVKERKQDEVNH